MADAAEDETLPACMPSPENVAALGKLFVPLLKPVVLVRLCCLLVQPRGCTQAQTPHHAKG